MKAKIRHTPRMRTAPRPNRSDADHATKNRHPSAAICNGSHSTMTVRKAIRSNIRKIGRSSRPSGGVSEFCAMLNAVHVHTAAFSSKAVWEKSGSLLHIEIGRAHV